MKFIKAMVLLGAIFSIAGMALIQLFTLVPSTPFAKQFIRRNRSRHDGLAA